MIKTEIIKLTCIKNDSWLIKLPDDNLHEFTIRGFKIGQGIYLAEFNEKFLSVDGGFKDKSFEDYIDLKNKEHVDVWKFERASKAESKKYYRADKLRKI